MCRLDAFAAEGQLRRERSTQNAGRDYAGRAQPSATSRRCCWRTQYVRYRHGKRPVRERRATFRRLRMRNFRWTGDAHWVFLRLGAAPSGPGESVQRGNGLNSGLCACVPSWLRWSGTLPLTAFLVPTRCCSQAFNACDVCNDPKIGDKGGVIGLLTGGRVSRPDYTRQSIEMAILSLKYTTYPISSSIRMLLRLALRRLSLLSLRVHTSTYIYILLRLSLRCMLGAARNTTSAALVSLLVRVLP